jgi:hypothetical protein
MASASKIPGQKTSGGSQLHEFTLWIDVPSDRKREIRQVSYRFNNSTFQRKLQGSSDAPTGFRVSYRGWGCLEQVRITLSLRDGSELPLDFNMCAAIGWK